MEESRSKQSTRSRQHPPSAGNKVSAMTDAEATSTQCNVRSSVESWRHLRKPSANAGRRHLAVVKQSSLPAGSSSPLSAPGHAASAPLGTSRGPPAVSMQSGPRSSNQAKPPSRPASSGRKLALSKFPRGRNERTCGASQASNAAANAAPLRGRRCGQHGPATGSARVPRTRRPLQASRLTSGAPRQAANAPLRPRSALSRKGSNRADAIWDSH
mmetsp:Transcript_80528/g.260961  ORF Transcript_80528/g.260961 Transcript_80528/m.260961 type:complete len:214 (+) Transcript_80528:491-1132(+)